MTQLLQRNGWVAVRFDGRLATIITAANGYTPLPMRISCGLTGVAA